MNPTETMMKNSGESLTPPDAPEAGELSGLAPSSAAASGRNPKRVSCVFLVLCVALVAGVIFLKNGPQAASGATLHPASLPAGVEDAAVSDWPGIRNVDRVLCDADKFARQFKFAPARVQVPLMDLKANPFRLSAGGVHPVEATEDPAEIQRREVERQSALMAVQSLRLQSILRGGLQRECTINNVHYQEGQEAGGFFVEEIASNTVVVRKGVYRFELKLSM